MKKITKIGAALVAALAAASTLAWSGPGDGAGTEWEQGSFYVDSPGVFVPCLGETVHFFGEVVYKRHAVTTPSGGTSYKYQEVALNSNQPPYFAVVESTGKVYRWQNGHPLNVSFHQATGETLSVHVRGSYVADDGDKLIGTFHMHLTTNANGELVVNRVYDSGFECIDR